MLRQCRNNARLGAVPLPRDRLTPLMMCVAVGTLPCRTIPTIYGAKAEEEVADHSIEPMVTTTSYRGKCWGADDTQPGVGRSMNSNDMDSDARNPYSSCRGRRGHGDKPVSHCQDLDRLHDWL